MHPDTRNAQQLYDEYPFGRFCYSDQRAKYYPLLSEFLDRIGPDARLCDVGCGAGFWMNAYLERGVSRDRITAIDLAPRNIEQLKAMGFNAAVGDVMSLDLPDSSFDFTICAGVIHHTPDPRRAFAELVRITRPGGAIYLAVYNKWHPYFYVTHKATFPLRWIYWRYTKRVVDLAYPLWKVLAQPAAYLAMGRFLDESTSRTLFMDQVMTPYAHLFSKHDLMEYAARHDCSVVKTEYVLKHLMLAAIIQLGPK